MMLAPHTHEPPPGAGVKPDMGGADGRSNDVQVQRNTGARSALWSVHTVIDFLYCAFSAMYYLLRTENHTVHYALCTHYCVLCTCTVQSHCVLFTVYSWMNLTEKCKQCSRLIGGEG